MWLIRNDNSTEKNHLKYSWLVYYISSERRDREEEEEEENKRLLAAHIDQLWVFFTVTKTSANNITSSITIFLACPKKLKVITISFKRNYPWTEHWTIRSAVVHISFVWVFASKLKVCSRNPKQTETIHSVHLLVWPNHLILLGHNSHGWLPHDRNLAFIWSSRFWFYSCHLSCEGFQHYWYEIN